MVGKRDSDVIFSSISYSISLSQREIILNCKKKEIGK